jgi:hypothetical protein
MSREKRQKYLIFSRRAPSRSAFESVAMMSASERGRAKTPRIFANNRAERNFSRFFRFQAV